LKLRSKIPHMIERENDCAKAGCRASCCHDVCFTIEMSRKEVLHFFPEAKKVNDFVFHSEKLPHGVYFHRESIYGYHVRIEGPCPLLEGLDCLIHKSKRPDDCKSLNRCSDDCNAFRRREQQREFNAHPLPPQP
jgi:hypothetical protein